MSDHQIHLSNATGVLSSLYEARKIFERQKTITANEEIPTILALIGELDSNMVQVPKSLEGHDGRSWESVRADRLPQLIQDFRSICSEQLKKRWFGKFVNDSSLAAVAFDPTCDLGKLFDPDQAEGLGSSFGTNKDRAALECAKRVQEAEIFLERKLLKKKAAEVCICSPHCCFH